jgi:hypothetical protein
MREISPAENLSADEFLKRAPAQAQQIVAEIRRQKKDQIRPLPSSKLIDKSILMDSNQRKRILDTVANLVDENLFGRSEMCMQFTDLLQKALSYLNYPARAILGTAIYYNNGSEIYRWEHAWVRIGKEVVDGNVDSLFENPMVPNNVNVSPYWGPITETPKDRRLREDRGKSLPPDIDVKNIWWPELREWLDKEIKSDVEPLNSADPKGRAAD